MKVKIWKFKINCYVCSKEMEAVWLQDHDINMFGYYLQNQEYCNVKRVFSNWQEKEVWGNICPSCGAYQGNQFIYDTYITIRTTGAVSLDNRIVESPDILPACTECGKKTEDLKLIYSDQIVCSECFQHKIPQEIRDAILKSEENCNPSKNSKPKSRKKKEVHSTRKD